MAKIFKLKIYAFSFSGKHIPLFNVFQPTNCPLDCASSHIRYQHFQTAKDHTKGCFPTNQFLEIWGFLFEPWLSRNQSWHHHQYCKNHQHSVGCMRHHVLCVDIIHVSVFLEYYTVILINLLHSFVDWHIIFFFKNFICSEFVHHFP